MRESCTPLHTLKAELPPYAVVIPRDAISALEPFYLVASLSQTAFVFAGRVTMAEGVRRI
jgi:hypothetical protein